MSVLDRVRRTPTPTAISGSNQTSPETSGTQTERSVVAQRIQLVVDELLTYASAKKDSPYSSHMWIFKSIFTGICEELGGASDEVLGHWISQFGLLLEWCGTGDDSKLPPEVLECLGKNHKEMLAIEAVKSV